MKQRWWNYYFVVLISSATIISGVINYVYHPVMIRMLDASSFALFASLMSLVNLISVLFTGLWLYLTQQVSMHAHDALFLRSFIAVREKRLRRISLLFVVFLLLAAPFIQLYLHIPDIRLLVIVIASVVLSGVALLYNAVLQWSHAFERIALLSFLGAVFRALCGISFVWYGWWLYGAILGVTIASLLSVWAQAWMTVLFRKWSISLAYTQDIVANFRGERKQIIRFSMIALLLTFLMQSDIFIVQHLFVGERAGSYGAVSVLAKFLFFLCSALETVYYPQLAKKTSSEVSSCQFRNYIVLFLFCVLCAIGGVLLFGTTILQIIKPELVLYKNLLLLLLAAWSGIFIISSGLKLLVARGRYKAAMTISILLCIVLLYWYSGNYSYEQFLLYYTGWVIILVLVTVLLLYSWLKTSSFKMI